jgi:hypothetical protein
MSEYFSLGGYIAAEVDVLPNGISGTGRAELPIISVQLQLSLNGPQGQGLSFDFREIRCRVSPFDTAYLADSRPTFLNVCIGSGQKLAKHWAYLEIPLDRLRLALLNRLRNGGDVKLRLDLELLADELVELTHSKGIASLPVWGLKARHNLQARVQLVIHRSVWVEQVLLGTEFAKIHIIELPAVPIESCSQLKSSFEALRTAQKLESQGFYHEAVGKCRIALEPFFEMVDKPDAKGENKKVPMLKSSWQTRLGQATYEWLNASLAGLKGSTNQAVHLSSTTFDQLETQMFLAVTTAIVAYAVKIQSTSES